MATVFDPCLRPNMAQTINVAVLTGNSGAGDPVYGAPVSYLARVEPKQKTITDANGEKVTSEYAIYTEADIKLYDRVWLPGDNPADLTLARRPLSVFGGVDEDGSYSHWEVYV